MKPVMEILLRFLEKAPGARYKHGPELKLKSLNVLHVLALFQN